MRLANLGGRATLVVPGDPVTALIEYGLTGESAGKCQGWRGMGLAPVLGNRQGDAP